jgi:uncharacterized protein YggT (Ycf19 family)
MELTERERRILAELEHQLSAGSRRRDPMSRPVRRGIRPQWTVVPSAILGLLLLTAGLFLGVLDAVIFGAFLLVWWTSPGLIRNARRFFTNFAADGRHG